jgi:hypothetical protein
MVYGTIANMKPLCSIAADDTDFDTELTFFLTKANNWINDALKPYEANLPLTSPDDVIGDAAEFYAAGLYMMKNQQDEKPHGYLSHGRKLLTDYIAAAYTSVKPDGLVVASSYQEIDEE